MLWLNAPRSSRSVWGLEKGGVEAKKKGRRRPAKEGGFSGFHHVHLMLPNISSGKMFLGERRSKKIKSLITFYRRVAGKKAEYRVSKKKMRGEGGGNTKKEGREIERKGQKLLMEHFVFLRRRWQQGLDFRNRREEKANRLFSQRSRGNGMRVRYTRKATGNLEEGGLGSRSRHGRGRRCPNKMGLERGDYCGYFTFREGSYALCWREQGREI